MFSAKWRNEGQFPMDRITWIKEDQLMALPIGLDFRRRQLECFPLVNATNILCIITSWCLGSLCG